jgi:hypothetical protein
MMCSVIECEFRAYSASVAPVAGLRQRSGLRLLATSIIVDIVNELYLRAVIHGNLYLKKQNMKLHESVCCDPLEVNYAVHGTLD